MMIIKKCLVWIIYIKLIFCINSANAMIMMLTEKDCGKTIKAYHAMNISLPAIPSAGYDWFLEENKAITVTDGGSSPIDDRDVGSGEFLVGQTISRIFIIHTQLQNFTLNFIYKRPWEKEIAKKCTMKFNDRS